MFPDTNAPIDLRADLINLSHYRKADRTANHQPDPLICLVAYAQEELIYDGGRIVKTTPENYATIKASLNPDIRNQLVNKFGLAYAPNTPMYLHRRLADVLVDTAIDLRDRFQFFTIAMDGLRTIEAGERMQHNRPDLVKSGMLSPSGTSAHNRALAVDTKLFQLITPPAIEAHPSSPSPEAPLLSFPSPARGGGSGRGSSNLPQTVHIQDLIEADEHGHLDDEQDMQINSRFYTGPMSEAAKHNRLQRLIAWQRASVKNQTPIANLLAEFWDDRVPGSPADLWRITACRLLCLGENANPATNTHIFALRSALNALTTQSTRESYIKTAYNLFVESWHQIFSTAQQQQLEDLLGKTGGSPPPLEHFIFHEWLQNIHDHHIKDHH